MSVILLVAFISCIVTGVLSYYLKIDSIRSTTNDYSNQTYAKYFSYVYQTPYCRIGAFVIGMLTGYEIHRLRNRIDIPKALQAIGYFVAIAMCIAIIYSPYQATWTSLGYSIYFSMARVVWSMAISLLIWLFAMKPNPTLDAFLSAQIFVILSNLSYCAYLIHPIVQYVYFYSFKGVIAGSHAIIFMNFIGITFFTYLFASIMFLTIEMPLLAFKSIRFRTPLKRK